MPIPVFYAPPANRSADAVTLTSSEAHHAAVVMRLQEGARVIVVDGCGMAVRGEIVVISKKSVEVRIHTEIRNFGEPQSSVPNHHFSGFYLF